MVARFALGRPSPERHHQVADLQRRRHERGGQDTRPVAGDWRQHPLRGEARRDLAHDARARHAEREVPGGGVGSRRPRPAVQTGCPLGEVELVVCVRLLEEKGRGVRVRFERDGELVGPPQGGGRGAPVGTEDVRRRHRRWARRRPGGNALLLRLPPIHVVGEQRQGPAPDLDLADEGPREAEPEVRGRIEPHAGDAIDVAQVARGTRILAKRVRDVGLAPEDAVVPRLELQKACRERLERAIDDEMGLEGERAKRAETPDDRGGARDGAREVAEQPDPEPLEEEHPRAERAGEGARRRHRRQGLDLREEQRRVEEHDAARDEGDPRRPEHGPRHDGHASCDFARRVIEPLRRELEARGPPEPSLRDAKDAALRGAPGDVDVLELRVVARVPGIESADHLVRQRARRARVVEDDDRHRRRVDDHQGDRGPRLVAGPRDLQGQDDPPGTHSPRKLVPSPEHVSLLPLSLAHRRGPPASAPPRNFCTSTQSASFTHRRRHEPP